VVTTSALPRPKELQRPRDLRSLTGLRWIAAFVVFGYHLTLFQYFAGGSAAALWYLFAEGVSGVSFFFVLSGFVLAWNAHAGDSAILFWRRRVARIYPVHLVTALLALALGLALVPALFPRSVFGFIANLFLLSSWRSSWWQVGNPVSWSLVVEAFFYLCFPLIFRILAPLRARALYILTAVMVLIVILLGTSNNFVGLPITSNSFPLARLPEFVIGIAVALLVRNGKWHGPGVLVAGLIAVAGYAVELKAPDSFRFAACTIIGFTLVIPALAKFDLSERKSILSGRVMVRLGELSFAFYMIHVIILFTARVFIGYPRLSLFPGLALTAGVFAIALGAALLLNVFVENPGRRLILRKSKRERIDGNPDSLIAQLP